MVPVKLYAGALRRAVPPGLLALLLLLLVAAPAGAARNQVSIIEDDPGMFSNPVGTLQQLRVLGAQDVRVPVWWNHVAPAASSHRRPRNFKAGDPGARGYSWGVYDAIAKAAAQTGVDVTFDVMGGAPLWATGRGGDGHTSWEPNSREYGQFVKAVAIRYSGSYNPALGRSVPGDPGDLPRVSSWSIWNEPDYGPSLAPQGLPGHLTIDYAPRQYRALVDQAWMAFQHTGHGHDTILFGELAPRGRTYWGVFSGMKPMLFLRSLYCVDSRYRPLRGSAARVRACPTTAAGRRHFRAAHPALFNASGLADHPYMRWYPPNHEPSPDAVFHRESTADYTSLGTIRTLERGLDRLLRVYGSHRRLPIYDTEFGYITSPPKRRWSKDRYPWVSPTTAAYYLNWAEYIHWRDPRLASFTQFLLRDPLPALRSNDYGGFASGLLTNSGARKPTYYAWRLPLYMPVTSARRGHSLEVWGCARPATYAAAENAGPQRVEIQAGPGSHPHSSAYRTVATVTLTRPSSCYFDVRLRFPGSGVQTVRLVWRYPASDPMGYFDPLAAPGAAIYSRHVQIRLR